MLAALWQPQQQLWMLAAAAAAATAAAPRVVGSAAFAVARWLQVLCVHCACAAAKFYQLSCKLERHQTCFAQCTGVAA
jgi:hypothetical protein